MLHEVVDVITVVGFPLAFIGIALAYLEGRNSRDLTAVLQLSDIYLSQMYFNFRRVVAQDEKRHRGEPFDAVEFTDTVLNVIGWLDMVGSLIHSKLLARPQNVLPPMGRDLRLMLDGLGDILREFESRGQAGRWPNLRVLDKTLTALGFPPDPRAGQPPQ